MKIIADTHTHTIVSGDAHSTLLENLRAAKEQGLKFLCVTAVSYTHLTQSVSIFHLSP